MKRSEEIEAGVLLAMKESDIIIHENKKVHYNLMMDSLKNCKDMRAMYSITLGMALALMSKDVND